MDDPKKERMKPSPRTGAAGHGDLTPEPDVKAIVDRVLDPERRTLSVAKEVTGRGH
jgi:hypothetical protein